MSSALAGSLKPAKVILVPGTIFCGLVTHALSLSLVQVIFALVSAAEYEKPATEAALRPATPNRFGPIELPLPFWTVWQAWHTANSCWPCLASAALAFDASAKLASAMAIAVVVRDIGFSV